MKNKMQLFLILFLCYLTITFGTTYSYTNHPPKLTVVIVIDQFAHHYINKLYPHLKHGLKYLLDNGIVFTNAHMPHGQPGTATGHAALNTGTYAKDHGFIGNGWITTEGEKTACDDDTSPHSYVLSPNEDGATYNYGKSSHLLMVDGLTDQCVMHSRPGSIFRSYSISGKSRSAVATASKMGKAVWFDEKSGLFTSSKAYFDELPEWLKSFNNKSTINELKNITWTKMYPLSPSAYKFFNTNEYQYSRTKKSMLNEPLAVPDYTNVKNPYHLFERTPQANKNLLNLAQECISKHVNRKNKDRLLLWLCLSPLDKVAHQYGPNSIEAIDMIYHLDKQLQKFIRTALRAVGKHQVVFSLTADHGIMPIPEILHKDGLTLAARIDQRDFVKNLNDYVKEQYGIESLIVNYKGQELVFDHVAMNKLDIDKKAAVIDSVKRFALSRPYIKNAWSFDELSLMPTQPHTIQDHIKNQLFKGRSGEIVLQPYPYTLVTHWTEGTSHKSPYDYDTHVPLILFHPGKFERKYVRQRVTTLQLANTLAEILNVPKPSASMAEVLPEVFDPEFQ